MNATEFIESIKVREGYSQLHLELCHDLVIRYITPDPLIGLYQEIMGAGNIVKEKFWLHESIEVLEYLKKFSPQQILEGGTEQDLYYGQTHGRALFMEYEYAQKLARERGYTIPKLALLLMDPRNDLIYEFEKNGRVPAHISIMPLHDRLCLDDSCLLLNPGYDEESVSECNLMTAQIFYQVHGYKYQSDYVINAAKKTILQRI
ncbi:MAG: hypothetical protein HGA85_04805 [Nanoarchaeota archaeon]|nr:hypothetical protein [Nanoarchaeota archaeon]